MRAPGGDMGRLTMAVAGGATGLVAWLPVPDVAAVCPAPGEGRTQCVLNAVWVAGLLHVMLGALAGALLVTAVRAAPGFLGAQRDWARRQAAPPPPEPDLLAARWDRMDRWTRAARTADERPRDAQAPPLPVGDDGRLAADDLRAWLAATGSEGPGPR